jgi:hypothetical protein
VIAQLLELAVQLDFLTEIGSFEPFEIQTSKDFAEHSHRKKEVLSAANPSFLVGRDSSPRDDAVHVGVMEKHLAPSVEDSEEADLRAEMSGIRMRWLSRSLSSRATASPTRKPAA